MRILKLQYTFPDFSSGCFVVGTQSPAVAARHAQGSSGTLAPTAFGARSQEVKLENTSFQGARFRSLGGFLTSIVFSKTANL